MGKATSNRQPTARSTVERNLLKPHLRDITFYVGGEEATHDAEGEPVYEFDVYRLTNWPWRPSLPADIEAHYNDWLAMAIQKGKAGVTEPTEGERLDQIEAGLIELAAIIAGGE